MLTTWEALATAAVGGAALLWLLLAPDARHRALRPLPCPPSTLPLLGNTLDLMTVQLHRLHDWILEQSLLHGGKTWRLQALGAPPLVVVSSVACFEDVLKTQFEVFDKGPRMITIFRDVMGDSIIAVDGEKWKQQRRVLVHLFTMRQFRDSICGAIATNLVRFGDLLERTATDQAQGKGDPFFPLSDAFQRFTFDVFTKISFGLDERSLDRVGGVAAKNAHEEVTEGFINSVSELLTLLELRFHQPDWLWKLKRSLNVGAERKLREAVQTIDRTIYSVIQRTLENSDAEGASKRQDVLALITNHLEDFKHASVDVDDPKKLSKFLRDVGLTMLTAGKDSSGSTLAWCMVMLAREPRVVDELRQELRSKFPKLFTDKNYVPSMEDVESHLVYVEAVIRETLRLCPTAPLNAKEANRDVTLCDGTFMKKGTRVYIPSYALGRMPSVWGPDANEFKPERWIDSDNKLRTVSSYQFVSFHAGPRICVGMRFALVELKTTLAYLLSKFDFELERDPQSYTYEMSIAYALKGPLRVRIKSLATK